MLYPIAIERGDEKTAFGVVVPDLEGCFSAGDTYSEALLNTKDAINMYLEALADNGELPPPASHVEDHLDSHDYDGWLWALIDINVDPFMGGAVKKNVTIPKILLKKIDDAIVIDSQYKDRSHFLQVAAMHELGL
ncbi:type II toxin-antitoxin system HicB family antitoxin [Photobacterium toruni]|uniref:Type II toxin-antitoxin system HicB family antitoxin n=1 Tax=Photobacterium toruni TaxID=1935446 RepID=A0ABU6L8X2_9GAMM|nr:type II toxin-antitoxin system HicB family antitoxin [Photobacterium toruni]